MYQGFLLRLLSSGALGGLGRRLLRERPWQIEGGRGAGLKIQLPQNRDFIRGSSEPPVQEALASLLRPGCAFYDVGANTGFFSLIAARLVGTGGNVYAFEPVPENAAAVRTNSQLNSLDNLSVFEVAVGSRCGNEELLLTEWDGGSTLSTSAVRTSEPVSKRTVRVVSLDDFIPAERLRQPDFVKIDVEGVELEVLKGMSKTMTESKPILLYEVDDGNKISFDRRWKELDDYVATFGYRITHLEASYANVGWNVGHSLAVAR